MKIIKVSDHQITTVPQLIEERTLECKDTWCRFQYMGTALYPVTIHVKLKYQLNIAENDFRIQQTSYHKPQNNFQLEMF